MSDDKKTDDAGAPVKKKGKLGKLLMFVAVPLVLVGGGVGAGVYASGAGLIGGAHAAAPADDRPRLVPKSAQKRDGEGGESGEGGHEGGEDESAGESHGGQPTPAGEGGDRFASNYYQLEKDFTSNLQDSVHFVQVGIAVSTPYDDKVIGNLKTNEIPVRSAVLMTLGDTTEDQVLSADGKRKLQRRLVKAINATLQQKEGFGGVSNVYFTNFVVQ